MDTQVTSSADITNETEKSSKDKYEYTFCRRCGRRLKTPENRARGMGRVCWEKSQITLKKGLFDANGNT